VLLGEGSEHVGDRLVEGARLARVDESSRALDHAVTEFVGDDAERSREAREHLAVAVAEHHPLTVPERVVVAPAIVHRCQERASCAVERQSLERVPQEGERRAQPVEGLVCGGVSRRGVVFAAHAHARQLDAAARVGDDAVGSGGRLDDERAPVDREVDARTDGPVAPRRREGRAGGLGCRRDVRLGGRCESREQIGRDDRVHVVTLPPAVDTGTPRPGGASG
jgi:hypothetical protein